MADTNILDAPASPDWTIAQNWDRYTAEEHATWDTLFARQAQHVEPLEPRVGRAAG